MLYAELTKASQDSDESLKWGCQKCVKKDKINSSSSSSSEYSKLSSEFKVMFSKLENFESKISSRLDDMNSGFKATIAELKVDTNDKIEVVKQDIGVNNSAIKILSREMVVNKRQLSDIHRLNNLCCLTISGVPKISSEDNSDVEIILKITQHYGITLSRRSIVFCSRLKTAKTIAPILVRFSSRQLAEELFRAYFESDPLLLSDISSEAIASLH